MVESKESTELTTLMNGLNIGNPKVNKQFLKWQLYHY